ncbi:MAG: 1-deoxy-D-xylulose-5-phosphate synthase [Rickettsiales bacterium]|nr:1-deoxy-D-xylulose-5-phosphate synthase [Rickettsiales bacterium]
MTKRSNYILLNKIKEPNDLRNHIPKNDLVNLCAEIRQFMLDSVSQTGGHLGAGLGVVELTVAIHYVFNTPLDKLIFDVGHQSYPHKILTDRKDRMLTIRQKNGLSGFTLRSESEYDPFGAGHSSTSISAAVGMAKARDLNNDDFFVIPVIGDGALSAGLAYEAINNSASVNGKFLIILNDNDMSIAKPTGAVSKYLSELISSKNFAMIRNSAKSAVKILPENIQKSFINFERKTKGVVNEVLIGSNLFENLGLKYNGPIDGHDILKLVEILESYKNNPSSHPVLLHLVTQKGKGYEHAENAGDNFHGVAKFSISTGKQDKASAETFTSVFSDELIKQAKKDEKIVAITAAMPSGTGLDKFAQIYPDRYFDVGIAEQHAVTFAAGLACQNIKPFVAIYSTFLQRAYDQIIHDVAIQNLPVKFAIDRAGYVGADGSTHSGSFDIAYLSCIPNFVIAAPSDMQELKNIVLTACKYNDGPFAFRYPRGNVILVEDKESEILVIGKGRVVSKGQKIAILSLGCRLSSIIDAADKFYNIKKEKVTICDMRFAKPIDKELIDEVIHKHEVVITVEEGSSGGFASTVNSHILASKINDVKVHNLFMPDVFFEQASIDEMYDDAEMSSDKIYKILESV